LKLNILFFKAEKDQFFSTLLFNHEKIEFNKENNQNNNQGKKEDNVLESEMIEQFTKIYFDNLVLSDNQIKLVQKPRSNQIDVIFGLNIPGIKTALEKVLKSIRDNVIKKYSFYENNLRLYFEEDERKPEIQRYIKGITRLNDYTMRLINNEKLLIQIINDNKKNNKFETLLINDYYTLFFNNIFKNIKDEVIKTNENDKTLDLFENNRKFLMYMIDIRNKNILHFLNDNTNDKGGKDMLNKLVNEINWIESYKEEISSIHIIFLKLSRIVPNLFGEIKKIINLRHY
jgi:hypothetical protein